MLPDLLVHFSHEVGDEFVAERASVGGWCCEVAPLGGRFEGSFEEADLGADEDGFEGCY